MNQSQNSVLSVHGLSKTYDTKSGPYRAIDHFGCEIEKGEIVCIVGPSGSGKTTLLRCLAGLISPTTGKVTVHDRSVLGPPKEIGLVFQDYSRSLLPWLTAAGNVALPLRDKGMSRQDRDRATAQALEAVGLAGAHRKYPWQLSGGMQQRVAIARALAYKPEVLLMDEPFASVDAQTRSDLEDLVLKVRKEFGMTIVLVTHDIDESVYLGDRVIVLSSPPSRVQDVIKVDLPEPRDQVSTKEQALFGTLRSKILREIKGTHVEVAAAASS